MTCIDLFVEPTDLTGDPLTGAACAGAAVAAGAGRGLSHWFGVCCRDRQAIELGAMRFSVPRRYLFGAYTLEDARMQGIPPNFLFRVRDA